MTYPRDRITVKEKYGAYLVSDIIEGYYTDKFYIGYTREEAIKDFLSQNHEAYMREKAFEN
jgi:hypothetical protein